MPSIDHKVKHQKNPFMGTLAKNISIVEKQNRGTSIEKKEMIDAQTGELETFRFVKTHIVDREKYLKVFSEGIKQHKGLTNTGKQVFEYFMQTVFNSPNKMQVLLSYEMSLLEPYNLKLAKRTFQRGMAELLQNGFIAHTLASGGYWVNPAYVWNGDRIEIVQAYEREQQQYLKAM